MDRRDIRDILFLVRSKFLAEQQEQDRATDDSGAAAAKRAATEAAEAAAEEEAAHAVAVSPLAVEQRLVGLDCDEIFQLCMRFI